MAIIILQHYAQTPARRIAATLRDHAFQIKTIQVGDNEPLPTDFDDVEGVVSIGGLASANDAHTWVTKELDFLKETHERNIPLVGVCLGAQLVARALGGTVAQMDQPEAGFPAVRLTPPAHTETILSGIAWDAPQFSMHEDHITEPPPGAVLLAGSDKCKVQAFKVGMRTFGFQYHFEADMDIVNDLAGRSQSLLHRAGLTTEEFNAQRDEHYHSFARLADRLCLNIATYLIPRTVNA